MRSLTSDSALKECVFPKPSKPYINLLGPKPSFRSGLLTRELKGGGRCEVGVTSHGARAQKFGTSFECCRMNTSVPLLLSSLSRVYGFSE